MGLREPSRGDPMMIASGFASEQSERRLCYNISLYAPLSETVNPPLPLRPVSFQSPTTQASPKLLGLVIATGLRTVTSSPLKLSQKSSPYFFGRSSGLATETRLRLFGTPKTSSLSRE